jgi:hypothetical protein
MPSSNGGSPIKGFRVYKNGLLAGDVGWNVYSLKITSNILAGITYQTSVAAYNDVGEGTISDIFDIMAA